MVGYCIFNLKHRSLSLKHFKGAVMDLPQEAVDVLKAIYGVSIKPFGRELPTPDVSSVRSTHVSLSILISAIFLLFSR